MRHTTTQRASAVAIVAAIALIAGCGGDDDDATSETTAEPPATTAGTETTAGSSPGTSTADTTPGTSAPAAASTTAPTDRLDRGAEFHFAIHYGWGSFGDPHKAVTEGDANWLRPIYERLMTNVETEDGGVELAPQLAESWETSDDGLSVTFHLRDGVTFQDDTPFDAEAVKANVERAQTLPESTVAGSFANVESVEAVDDLTVVFHLSAPDPELLWSLSAGLPGLMISPAAFDTDLQANPVGTGPYTLVSIQKDADAVYERWDGHWDPEAALVQRLVLSTVFDANARYNGLRDGGYDATFLQPPLDAESQSLLAEGYHSAHGLTGYGLTLAMNSDIAPFDDVRVRKAVSMAINRTEISEQLLAGLFPPVSQAFNPGFLGHDPSLPDDAYDPDEARRLIEEAGADGASFEMIHSTGEPQNSMGPIIQQELSQIGLEVELLPLSPSEQAQAWRKGGTAAFLGYTVGQPEPSTTLRLTYLPGPGSNNPASSVDPELVAMADAARSLPVDSAEREQAYQDIAGYLYENPIHAPLLQFSSTTVCRPEVVGCESLFDAGRWEWRGLGILADA